MDETCKNWEAIDAVKETVKTLSHWKHNMTSKLQ